MPWLDDVLDSLDRAGNVLEACETLGMAMTTVTAADGVVGELLDDLSDLLAPEGESDSLTELMSRPDPLLLADTFRFQSFTFAEHDDVLVDEDGDGIADRTAWGTPVEWIDGYTRADGTEVDGHYRTVADNQHWNNLGTRRT